MNEIFSGCHFLYDVIPGNIIIEIAGGCIIIDLLSVQIKIIIICHNTSIIQLNSP